MCMLHAVYHGLQGAGGRRLTTGHCLCLLLSLILSLVCGFLFSQHCSPDMAPIPTPPKPSLCLCLKPSRLAWGCLWSQWEPGKQGCCQAALSQGGNWPSMTQVVCPFPWVPNDCGCNHTYTCGLAHPFKVHFVVHCT